MPHTGPNLNLDSITSKLNAPAQVPFLDEIESKQNAPAQVPFLDEIEQLHVYHNILPLHPLEGEDKEEKGDFPILISDQPEKASGMQTLQG